MSTVGLAAGGVRLKPHLQIVSRFVRRAVARYRPVVDKNKPRCEGAHRGWNDLNDPGEFMQVPAQGGEAGDGSHRL